MYIYNNYIRKHVSTIALLNNLAPACRAVPGPLDDESLYGGPPCMYNNYT
jgi:hypothetical protein